MKRKIFSVFFALVLVLTLGLVTAAPVAAASIINVPGNYSTIQEAITEASAGDTILVTGGTYAEDLVIPADKTGLELVGASGATIKGVATEPDANFPAGVPNIEILASGVKIHGFTIESPDALQGQYASGMLIGAANVEIYDNAFETNIQDTSHYSVVIQTLRAVVFPTTDISGLNIHHNTFDSTGDGEGYDGIFVNLDEGAGLVRIVGNTFAGSLMRAISVERSNVVIDGNSIVSSVGGVQGMYIGCFPVEGDAPGPLQQDVSIIGNTVEGFVQGIRVGHTTSEGFSGIVISQNTVQANTDGIIFKAPSGATVGVIVSYNNILSNSGFGVNNATTDDAVIDAPNNWWGTAVEAEIMALVSGNVDYDPWLGGLYSPDTVVMSASYTLPAIGISVSPESVDFENVVPDVATDPETVIVTNDGDVDVDLSTQIINESVAGVYTTGLVITWAPAPPENIAPLGTADASLVLTVPSGTAPGTYTATLVFWAEASP